MYHVAVHPLAERVLSHVRKQELLKAGERVGVAVSGGIDSVALMRLLLELRGELGIVLSVVHFNHKLRGAESDDDERFVAELARSHNLEFHCDSDDVAEHAHAEGVSLETAARELRYGFFRSLILPDESAQEVKIPTLSQTARQGWGTRTTLDKIVTGHTLDDQAETVLMRLIRGAGLRGLGGIHLRIAVEDEDDEVGAGGEIVRPLLSFRRRELEAYLNDIGQSWREDATNFDEKFTRNRVRKLVLPLLEKEFNPSVAENLAELAEIARGEEDYWENEVSGWMGTGVHWSEPEWARRKPASDGLIQIALSSKIPTSRANTSREMGHPRINAPETNDLQSRIDAARWLVMNASVDRMWFLGEPAAVQRRLIKAVGENAGLPLEFKHVEEILRFAGESGGSGKELSLPLGWRLVRKPDELVFVTPDLREPNRSEDYDYALPIPGCVKLPELGVTIEARRVRTEEGAGYNPEQLLDADSLPGPLRVRNWRAGDRFWPNHTKSPKKIKELLQERHVAQPERKLWPVLTSGNEIVWLRGFPAPAQFRAKPGRESILILETLAADETQV
jgi:tRNA(Ile)-lysidine synthase